MSKSTEIPSLSELNSMDKSELIELMVRNFSIEELFDYEYLEIQVQTHFNNM